MKTAAAAALAILAALSFAARADEPLMQRRGDSPPGYGGYYRPQARQGLLLSVGLGGGSLYLSDQGRSRIGAGDVDFRLGYGFSDQFQMFMDLNADSGSNANGNAVGSWTATMRGQVLLIGDRRGNGLNANLGAGFGGLTYNTGASYGRSSGPTGFAVAGGISYDARITPWMSFSPEFFVTWHQVPNAPGFPDDVSSIYGLRLNLLWYLH